MVTTFPKSSTPGDVPTNSFAIQSDSIHQRSRITGPPPRLPINTRLILIRSISCWPTGAMPPPSWSGSAPSQRFYPIYLPPVVISAGPDGEFDLRRTFYNDENGTPQGVNDNYSTAIITWDPE